MSKLVQVTMGDDGFNSVTVDTDDREILTRIIEIATDTEVKEWYINADGYYPQCPMCNYEPPRTLLESVGGLGNLRHCPKCKTRLRF